MACCMNFDLNYSYDQFSFNECCINMNAQLYKKYDTLLEKYDVFLKKQKKYEIELLVGCCFLLCLLLNKFKFSKKTYKENKIKFDYDDTAVYF